MSAVFGRTMLSKSIPTMNAPAKTLLQRSLHCGSRPSKQFYSPITRSLPRKRHQSVLSDGQAITHRPGTAESRSRRIIATVAAIGAGTVAINALLNRETRTERMHPFDRDFLNKTFAYTGMGLGAAAAVAIGLHRSGASVRIMRANPWVVLGVSLVGSIGCMAGTMATDADRSPLLKHMLWLGFSATQGAVLSPLLFLHPALLIRAALYTTGMMGSICYIGATAKSEQYLWLGAPLMGGLVVVALSSLAPMILPVGTAALAWTEAVSLYGGLAVFGGFTLYDTQKILMHARLVREGRAKTDPINSSISLILDFVNIFIRMVSILGGQQRKK